MVGAPWPEAAVTNKDVGGYYGTAGDSVHDATAAGRRDAR
jgi:hypothetical protein